MDETSQEGRVERIIRSLMDEWASGELRLRENRILFQSQEDVELLNAITGGGFLWDVQIVFWDDLMLRLAKLTDPVKGGRGREKKNLTVQLLPAFCCDDSLRDEMQRLVNEAVEATEFAREWRNKRIGHTDLERALSPNPEPLADSNREKAQAALNAIFAVVKAANASMRGVHLSRRVVSYPRAAAFITHVRQTSEALRYIDSLIDPDGSLPITDHEAASRFLGKVGREVTLKEVRQVVELREAARRFVAPADEVNR